MSDIIPCMAILAFFVPLFTLIVIMRYISYRETLALAEKGLMRPQKQNDGKDALRWGIAITAVGLALCMGLWPLGFLAGNTFPLGLGPWMLIGFVPTFFGLALILIFVLTFDRKKSQPPQPVEKAVETSEV
jgi:sterol desaturase/sphingolipid hydroxylase (fatty acid hydroxylase superfamily)